MSRVYAPTMVGNDVVVNLNRNLKQNKRPPESTQEFQESNVVQEPVDYQFPAQNFGAVAVDSPLMHQSAFAMEPVSLYGSRFFSKTKIVSLAMAVVLIAISVGAIVYKQQVMGLVDETKSFARQVISGGSHQKVIVNHIVNYQQTTIPSANLDAAVSSIVSQTITLKAGSTSVAVSQSDIINWLNYKTKGSQTLISVNTQQIASYLSQFAVTNSHKLVNQVILSNGYGHQVVDIAGENGISVTYNQAIVNQIANNLLKVNGVTVTLPTTVTPFQTTYNSPS